MYYVSMCVCMLRHLCSAQHIMKSSLKTEGKVHDVQHFLDISFRCQQFRKTTDRKNERKQKEKRILSVLVWPRIDVDVYVYVCVWMGERRRGK